MALQAEVDENVSEFEEAAPRKRQRRVQRADVEDGSLLGASHVPREQSVCS